MNFPTLRESQNMLSIILMGNIMLVLLNNKITHQKSPHYAEFLCAQLESLKWFLLLQ